MHYPKIINKNERLSNIELLRILSMFGVLICHANFGALGKPTHTEFISEPLYTIIRTFIEAFSIVAVNVFILISGYFGIKFSYKSLCKLVFQCAFFFFGIYIISSILGGWNYSFFNSIYMCLMFSNNAWFVKCYIGLFIIAPVINSFIENSQRKNIEIFLLSFFIFQSLYGWFSNGAEFIKDGYSTFSFIGLYSLMRYVKKYRPQWSELSIGKDFTIYAIFSTITALGMLLFIYLNIYPIYYIFFKYSSMFIIIASLFLVLGFSKLSFKNKFINKVALSSFAVYLLHFTIFPHYISPLIRNIYSEYNGIIMFCLIVMTLIIFYTTAILIDQLRIILWNIFSFYYFKK